MAGTVTEIKKGLKPRGMSQNEVVVNLDFLVQHGWVLEEIERRTYKGPARFLIVLPRSGRTNFLT